ncbi:unnamed protein product [Ilex paraguariensis]|uniref:Disease resistance RPP13-like protein 1 n=1 Tax=Ilex paraguariensis TaxID=185542 RepID=A0ABC8U2L9_9AQUA
MALVEVFLGAFMTVLFERLASHELLNFARREGIHAQLEKLSVMLMTIRAVLSDAEAKQITEEAVKLWLNRLSDLAYDLDDLLDEIATEALAHELKSEPEEATTSKVRRFIPTCCTNFRRSVSLKIKMGPKIEEITARLQDIAKLKNDLDLRVNREAMSNTETKRLPTSCLPIEPHVYGREDEKKEILGLVFRDEACNDEPCIIPIVGMGGVGKTTLAQFVYNDEKVGEFFDLRAWVCVSEVFDVFMITRIIHEAVTKERCVFKDFSLLQESLNKKLSGRKFFIVLDDVWNQDYEKWDLLRVPFRVGLPGSKIVVTTRNEGVASIMGSVPAYRLNVLAESDCLCLLAQHALGTRNFDDHPNLGVIGKDIVKKCARLPLAAKTIGGLLRTKHSPKEWKDVLNSKIWELTEHKSGILPALRLSYQHLPSQLKQMFAYCAVFPKDYEFDKDELVLLWMAQGFLQQSKGMEESMEELGDKCFSELLSRSFFQRSGGTESKFVMHELLNDLAQYVAEEICFRLDDNMESNERCKISQKARHSSFIRHKYEVYKRFKAFHELQRLRTFIPLPLYKLEFWIKSYLSNSIVVNLLPNLRCLRVLSLSGYEISELPNSIGDLKNLRYLNLSQTLIKWLPESVNTLYNLQTLSLRGCRFLCKLPTHIGNLVNLRHLDLRDTPKLEEMPSGIGRLKCLQTLPKILVRKNSGFGLRDLNSLLLLRGMLSVVGLENVMDVRDAEDANLSGKQYLNELEFQWNSDIEDTQREGLQVNVLDMLRPHRELKSLKIELYKGITFPSWIGDLSFSKTMYISLEGCTKCESLPPLGQLPLLKELYIKDMHAVKSVGAEFYCSGSTLEIPFLSLEILQFNKMLEWKEWSFSYGVDFRGSFPCLRELTIQNCPKLVGVPLLRLLSLCKLEIENCDQAVLKSFTQLPSLRRLKIKNVSGIIHLQTEFTNGLVSLEDLEFWNCAALVTLWQNGITPESLSCCKRVAVWHCPLLVQLLEVDQMLPCNLERLQVDSCENLERLPYGLKSHTSLKEVEIRKCPKLVSFPEESLPPMLRRLCIVEADSLESIPNCITRLEVLELRKCSSLRSLPTNTPLSALKSVSIWDCRNLEWVKETVEQSITSGSFGISNWPNLGSLRVGLREFVCGLNYQIDHSPSGSGLLTPNLVSLYISGFENPFSFPSQSHSLIFLKSLSIRDCRSLESFPGWNFPRNLETLFISNCRELKPLSEWGLQRLSSLRRFTMERLYPELLSFPDSCFLPPTLTNLYIDGFSNLESLSEGLRNLTSLEHLKINNCPKIKSLSEGLQNLTSLEHLEIKKCPELGSLPNERILDTLSSLVITRCPLLEERCYKEKGVDWPKIAHIPCVRNSSLS